MSHPKNEKVKSVNSDLCKNSYPHKECIYHSLVIMKKKEHIARHEFLHKALDELCADFIDRTGNLLSDTTVMDLMSWSSLQTITPSVSRKSLRFHPQKKKIED